LEWIWSGGIAKAEEITFIKPETKYGNSRFDIYFETKDTKNFVEVKGVTLEKDGVAAFPDAPTERGLKHIRELAKCIKDGYQAYIVFVIQMSGMKYFTPNDVTQPEFRQALIQAKKAGVHILAMECGVTEDELWITDEVEVKL
jgi:sugar fermentation stimulation protein A